MPFIPQPYPDEILGSWLARIFLQIGRGAWHPLLESAGYGQRTEALFFDVLDYSYKIENLLKALGTTYERALTELTTLPYWLVFDAADLSEEKLRGTKAIPRQIDYLGKPMSSICSIGIGRTHRKSLQPRFCPQCLEQDRIVHGEPYWHRVHQLPNVFFCFEHHCPLQTICPLCNQPMVSIANRLIDLPRLECICGHDFRNEPYFERPPDVYLKLTEISTRALNCTQPTGHYDQVRMHLRSLIDNSNHRKYDQILAAAFKVTRDTNTELCADVPSHLNHSAKLRLRGYFGMAAAPECCALLVALGVNFDMFAEGLQRSICSVRQISATPIRIPACSWTIDLARLEILRRVAAYTGRPPSAHKILYWFLRINDAQWLVRQFPTILVRRMPSITEDRRKIKQIVNDSNMSACSRQRKITNISAGMRAQIRDQLWFDKRLNQLQDEQRKQANTIHQDINEQRATMMENALQTLLRVEGRPTRIFASTLAAAAGLTHTQASVVIRAHPQLRNTIAAANNDKPRRQLLWAARQLLAGGHALTAYNICRVARLPRSAATSTLIFDIVAQLK